MKVAGFVFPLLITAVTLSSSAFAQSALEDLEGVAEDPAGFDGGPGSTLNDIEEPAEASPAEEPIAEEVEEVEEVEEEEDEEPVEEADEEEEE